ncbi:MAG: DUF1311 domain-containing protein [Nitrosomonadales bacterium]|nr:MAG: DUF1311 domain-containing protein [Nitrosomonadales bacterium]
MRQVRENISRLTLFVLLGGLVLPLPAQAASFDCDKAQTKVEHLICDDPQLSELDNKLAQDYQDVLSKADDEQKQRVVAEQKHWLKFTRNVCGKATCLKHAYWSRQAALENFFEPRSALYEKESDKAEAIKHILMTAPLYSTYDEPFCRQIFDALTQMKDIRFVDPVAQVQSYEDAALDPWKKQCRSAPPFNFTSQCERNIRPSDADDVVEGCNAGYGLPPFKIYELPLVKASGAKRYILYADDAYGPMNRDFRKPSLGGGFAGFRQIDTSKCLSALGNRWERDGNEMSAWSGASVFADAGQGGRNGKNYNSIIEFNHWYYFLVLHEQYDSYWLDIESVAPYGTKGKEICHWSPVKR